MRSRGKLRPPDVVRVLATHLRDPVDVRQATDAVSASPHLLALPGDGVRRYTARDYLHSEAGLRATATTLVRGKGRTVETRHADAAIRAHTIEMRRGFDGRLSAEQTDAIRNTVDPHGAARVTEIHRQRAEWQKRASRDLAEGRVDRAVDASLAGGAVTEAQMSSKAIDALVERDAGDTLADDGAKTRLALAHRRNDVHALKRGMRAGSKGRSCE